MSGFNGPPRRFRVDAATSVKDKVQELYRQARQSGRVAAFTAALRQIQQILRERAREAGEPLRLYRNAKFELRVLAVSPIVVWFLVHQDQLEVVVSEIVLLAEA